MNKNEIKEIIEGRLNNTLYSSNVKLNDPFYNIEQLETKQIMNNDLHISMIKRNKSPLIDFLNANKKGGDVLNGNIR